MIRSLKEVLRVEKFTPFIRIALPEVSGLLALTVATSNTAFALAAIALGRAGGSGMAHAVSAVARFKSSGRGLGPCVQVPFMEFPSALSFPSYVPPMPPTDILTV